MNIKINKALLTPENAHTLLSLCPFSAIEYSGGELTISSGCKLCGLCVKNGGGVFELEKEEIKQIDKSKWRGIVVYAQMHTGRVHNVSYELLGCARQLARSCPQPVYALLIGHNCSAEAQSLCRRGADRVFIYDSEELDGESVEKYTDVFENFINKVKPCAVLVGATVFGRTLAPRVAARFRTGLTADCTVLQMKENSDLVQIRPAFGGNIMAQIITPNHRPQFCTARYKVFSSLPEDKGRVCDAIRCEVPKKARDCESRIIKISPKEPVPDIVEADVLVAVGRAFKTKRDIDRAEELAALLGGRLACTRPLVEAGLMSQPCQIGLSGRTVKPKLIITLGVSGAVQFTAGMKGSECIIAVNSDERAPIFSVAHYAVVGDAFEVLPRLVDMIKKETGEK